MQFKHSRSHCLSFHVPFFLFPVLIPKEKPPITVVGDVGGRIAIIVVRDLSLVCSSICTYYLNRVNLKHKIWYSPELFNCKYTIKMWK